MDKYKVYDLLFQIRPLLDKRTEFPEDLKFTKDFYNQVHEIGWENISNSERIISLSTLATKYLEESKVLFSDSEYNLFSELLKKTRETELYEEELILDLLISLDKEIKRWQKFPKDPKQLTAFEYLTLKTNKVDLSIFDIDVI